MALIPAFFMDCVAAIGVEDKETEQVNWIASGFFYGHYIKEIADDEALYHVYLVTNKHVFRDLTEVRIRFNSSTDKVSFDANVELINKEGKQLWFGHPSKEIDIAVIKLNIKWLRDQNKDVNIYQSDSNVANIAKMNEIGLSEGDFIYVLGFPMGIVGGEMNTVIVRSGVIARIRDALAGLNNEFLIDASVYPGNSGGPVISKPEALAITGTKTQDKAYVIGIVKSYVPYQDIAYSRQTNRPKVIFEENSGLAVVHPIDYIQEVIMEHLKLFENKEEKKIS